MRAVRSILAVLAGIVASAVLVGLCDAIMMRLVPDAFAPGSARSAPVMAIAAAYSVAIAFFAGWLIARLAPAYPVEHAAVFGALSVLVTVLVFLSGGPTPMPMAWTGVTVALIVVASLAGARLYVRRSSAA